MAKTNRILSYYAKKKYARICFNIANSLLISLVSQTIFVGINI